MVWSNNGHEEKVLGDLAPSTGCIGLAPVDKITMLGTVSVPPHARHEVYILMTALNPGGAQNWGWSEVTRCINKVGIEGFFSAPVVMLASQCSLITNHGG